MENAEYNAYTGSRIPHLEVNWNMLFQIHIIIWKMKIYLKYCPNNT